MNKFIKIPDKPGLLSLTRIAPFIAFNSSFSRQLAKVADLMLNNGDIDTMEPDHPRA